MDFQYVGHSNPLHNARLKATGQARYTGDLEFDNLLHAKILFSPVAHAKIKKIDTSKAEALPGVKAVACYLNSPQTKYNGALRFYEHALIEDEMVFSDIVRFVGDRVAAVAAIDVETAERALELIEVEYEELPAVFDCEDALLEGATDIHPNGNKVGEINLQAGNVDEVWDKADHVYEDKYILPAIHHGAMERHVSVANFDANGKLTLWTGTQNSFAYRIILSKVFDLPMSKVRVIKPTLGGAFGGKLEMSIEVVAVQLAKMTGSFVKVELSREEAMVSTRTRHGAVVYVKTGVMNDGTMIAHDMKVIINTGAYTSSAMNVVGAMSHKVFKMYKTENVRYKGIPAYTNLPIAGAMRGYGSTQAFYAQQLQFNRICNELKWDMVDFLKKNLVEPTDIEQVFKRPIGNPRPQDCLIKGAAAFDWSNKALSEDNGRYKVGIGVAAGCHGSCCFGAHRDVTAMTLKMNEDGTAILYTGTHDMGNGSVTVQKLIVAENLGIDLDKIDCVESDTDLVPWNLGDYASRGTYISGNAAKKVAENVRKQILEEASKMLETPEEKLDIKDGVVFNVEDSEIKASLCDVIVYTQRVSLKEIVGTETYAAISGPTSYGVDFAKVEVDTETGKVRVLEFVAAHDVGKAINPVYTKGQAQGGIMMGIGYATTEELIYDEKGKLINGNLFKYDIKKATELPKTEVVLVEEIDATGPYGAKSIGECAVIPVAPAVANAICNALNLDLHHMPLSPKRIIEALSK